MLDVDVLVVGAGPVGLTLAMDLGQRGTRVRLIERNESSRQLPKMERCNARTMEIFRRLGVADTIRSASKFTDVPMDVFVISSMAEPPLLHLEYPSSTECKRLIESSNDPALPLEPYQLISQYTLEPLLRRAVEQLPNVTVDFGHELLSFEQNEDRVTALISDGAGTSTTTAKYLVGSDGGGSTVRKQLGIPLEGDGRIRLVHQIFFRSEALFDHIPMGKGRHYYAPNGALIVQDDLRHFMLNVYDVGPDPVQTVLNFLRIPADIEILATSEWHFNLLLAGSYRHDRVFLAGDAAHLVIPTAGLGMNTGIGDAVDLSWKLAGSVTGWGGPDLLASYEIERRPIGARNIKAARTAAEGMLSWQNLCTLDLTQDTEAVRMQRSEVSTAAAVGQRVGHELSGIELGYRYRNSPIIAEEADPHPDLDGFSYVPNAVPGSRAPHVRTSNGRPLQDILGPWFTLLRLGDTPIDTTELEKALLDARVPFTVLDLPDPAVRERYERDIVIVRPDLHVVWRGDELPAVPSQLAAQAVGWRRSEVISGLRP